MPRVKVSEGTQVSFDGTTYQGGEVFECSTAHAERFIAAGWAKAVGATTARKPKPRSKKK